LNYSWYITPEEYEIAKNNGIKRHTLENRIRCFGWSKEKAINTPVRKNNRWSQEIKKTLEKNGIGYLTFLARIYKLGWSVQKASTKPVMNVYEQCKIMGQLRRRYPVKYIRLAERNGISAAAFRARVGQLKWPMDKAATTPIGRHGPQRKELAV
jgi:hypothetical protein